MKYYEKLSLFFKEKKLSQKKVSEIMEVSPAMIGRYLSGKDNFSPDFVCKLLLEFPEIDLKYIFSENSVHQLHRDSVNEPQEGYLKQEDILNDLSFIEEKIGKIKEYLAQNCHNN